MQSLGQAEVDYSLRQLAKGMPPEQALNLLSTRLVNKLMHQPSVGLRQAAYDGREDLLELISYLYTNPDENNK